MALGGGAGRGSPAAAASRPRGERRPQSPPLPPPPLRRRLRSPVQRLRAGLPRPGPRRRGPCRPHGSPAHSAALHRRPSRRRRPLHVSGRRRDWLPRGDGGPPPLRGGPPPRPGPALPSQPGPLGPRRRPRAVTWRRRLPTGLRAAGRAGSGPARRGKARPPGAGGRGACGASPLGPQQSRKHALKRLPEAKGLKPTSLFFFFPFTHIHGRRWKALPPRHSYTQLQSGPGVSNTGS